ncbi:hypothetical protein DXG03_000120 [Asterophora parasitica]|uniref:Peptidase S53 domain-containing protein n=1 Tax=Asterophora parasitica TaxID=117018 RepID=A0A9P7GF19_9AGAR|nr:hypothetical protein DXG03_000120 [Asterophora parasitica]
MQALCRRLLSVLFVASLGLAAPSPGAHKVKETVNPPRGWVKDGIPSSDHTIVLRIGLPQPNFSVLENHLYEVSDPDHPRYGAHLSKEEVESLIAPHPESINVVDEWLDAHGITEDNFVRSPAKDWVTLTIPIHLAEKMLDTKYNVWKNANTGEQIVRTTHYSLPEKLHEHIEVVQPTTMFAQFKAMRSTISWPDETEEISVAQFKGPTTTTTKPPASVVPVDASCNTTITLKCLQQLYNFVDYKPTAKGNSIGITGYLEEFANIQDLQSFYADQRPEALGSTFKFVSVKGGLNNQTLEESGAEAALDVQYAFGLAYPIPGTFYSTAGRPPFKPDLVTPDNTNEPYANWLDYVLYHPNPPLSISTSYGDDEQTVPESYARRTCASFAQLGARGVSLLFSSGDWGVGDNNPDPATHECYTNDGKNKARFIPLFPASVTSVGGTVHYPEEAVSRFFSGGGFSDYFPRPLYQQLAVGNYVNSLPKGIYKGLYNP